MIITPHLEKLIWEQKAEYRTWTIGTPAAGLDVQENETVIIVGFEYEPYVDPEEAVLSDFNNFVRRISKQVTFQDKDRRFNFLCRTELNLAFDGTTFSVIPAGSCTSYDTYMAFSDNISCNVVNIPSPEGWAGIVTGAAPNKSEQPKTPTGYGTVNTPNIATIQRAQITGSSEFRAFPQTRTTVFGAPGFTSNKDFQVPIDGSHDTNFDPQPTAWGSFTYPAITVHYVRINKRLTDTFI